ncbi:MAG: hypothetical protein VKK63_11125 [Synechococcus sp.]|nr:hypothetical protein [Synechococcus sp.]
MKIKSFFPALATAVSLGAGTYLTTPAFAGTIGTPSDLKFNPAILSSFCDLNIGNGSLGSNVNRQQITSDATQPGKYSGSRTSGSISAVSNLDNSGAVVIDPPSLTGGTPATVSQLSVNGSAYSSVAYPLSLDATGTLATTPVNVKFSTTNNNNKFANGTYSAMATVTCTDDGSI